VRNRLTRKIVALAAAYAVALHALLPVVALAAADADTLAVICASERTGTPLHNAPLKNEPSAACVMACASVCAAAGLVPERATVAFAHADAMAADTGLGRDGNPRAPSLAHTFQARAPPA
jgi:hypothetical protein